jgi:N-acyl-D-aspartate/D-glutamate deacylase
LTSFRQHAIRATGLLQSKSSAFYRKQTKGTVMYDLVIRGATVIDGLGHDPRRADVAIAGGRIAAIGDIGRDAARKVVDAGGLGLMPGIIDIHTHYDAQVTWDPTLSPSPSLGVTTVVTGNCGFGIVPSPPHLRDLIMRNLAVVEGMDLDALRAGIDWRFESFAEYLDAVRRAGPYANVAVLIGHSAVRTAVMGEDASVRKEPTGAEMAEMKRLVAEAMAQSGLALPIRQIIRDGAASRCRRRSATLGNSMRWSAQWADQVVASSRLPRARSQSRQSRTSPAGMAGACS